MANLIDLIHDYAETRHKHGAPEYNAMSRAALDAVLAEMHMQMRVALEALRDIANILGGGPCSDNTCRGCAFEHEEAARIANNTIRALAQETKT